MSTAEKATQSPSREALEARYQAAVAQVRRRQRVEEGQSGALVFAALAYGDTLETSSVLSRASHLAKLVCIAALFIIPNLLVIHVLL